MRLTRSTAVIALGAIAWVGMPAQAQAQDPEKLDFFGDFRLRAESNHKLLNNTQHDRFRGRLRLRFGANYQATDSLKVGFRARTGNPDDPTARTRISAAPAAATSTASPSTSTAPS